MSDIAKARELVKAAREKIASANPDAADLLARAEQMMHRARPSEPVAPARYSCTREQAARIRALASADPHAQLIDTAYQVGTGIARVSEVLSGKR